MVGFLTRRSVCGEIPDDGDYQVWHRRQDGYQQIGRAGYAEWDDVPKPVVRVLREGWER